MMNLQLSIEPIGAERFLEFWISPIETQKLVIGYSYFHLSGSYYP